MGRKLFASAHSALQILCLILRPLHLKINNIQIQELCLRFLKALTW